MSRPSATRRRASTTSSSSPRRPLTSLSAGKLLAWFGWEGVNYAVFPMVVLALVMIGWLATHKRKPVQAG